MSTEHPNTIDFIMPSPRMIREYERQIDEDKAGAYTLITHTKCGAKQTLPNLIEELKFMREHYHECANEIYHSIDSGVFVKVRLLENGQTELYVYNNRERGENKNITKTSLLYPVKDADKQNTNNSTFTVDADAMKED